MSFTVPYEFEGMVNFKTPRVLAPALSYGRLSKARRIEITGYRGATRLSDCTTLTEHEGIVSGFETRDRGMARAAITRHVESGRRIALEAVERAGGAL